LTAKQNVEGLCYDKNNNRLLLAIKDEEPGNVNYKGVYSFDLASKEMAEAPVFKLDLTDKLLTADAGKKKADVINPSDIAINPVTGNIYITDGTKSKLLVTDPKGNVKAYYQLNSNEFVQPEGIAFKPDGELFISNEGKKQAGNIMNVVIAE
jgi:sugar lactone lactonase YvrE